MDPQLQALVSAAERGEACPAIRLVAGTSIFIGRPAPTAAFNEKMEWAVAEEIWNQGERPRKSDDEAVQARYREVMGQASGLLASVRDTEDVAPETTATLSLVDVQWWPISGGDGLELPAVRVPIETIDGWWLAGGKKLRAGGNWFFGVFVPVDV